MFHRRWILTLALLACARAAGAHPAPYSYIDVRLGGGGLSGAVVVHVFDAAHDLGVARPEHLLDADAARGAQDRLTRLLGERLHLTADGEPLPIIWGDVVVVPDRQGLRAPFRAAKGAPGRLDLTARLFPYDPVHQTFVNVYEDVELRGQAIVDADHPTFTHYSGSARGAWAVMGVFLPAGVHHILIGPDHVLFLIALVLLGGSLGRLLGIVTAFTAGHSVTLSLAAAGVVAPRPSLVEPAIALSIVVVGLDNLLVRGASNPRDLRPWAALLFGLVHGFGFASVLQEFGLPRGALGWSLFSFNLGVEIGQIAIVAAAATLVLVAQRRSLRLADRVAVLGSLAVVLAGTWWFAQRIFFPGGL